jgi:hypothetical protein
MVAELHRQQARLQVQLHPLEALQLRLLLLPPPGLPRKRRRM